MSVKKNIKKYRDNPIDTIVTEDVRDISGKEGIKQYTSKYKLNILKEVEELKHPGELGALLRREGLCSSHLATWFWQRERGELVEPYRNKNRYEYNSQDILTKKIDDLEREFYSETEKIKKTLEKRIAILEQENRELKKELAEANFIINSKKIILSKLEPFQQNEACEID